MARRRRTSLALEGVEGLAAFGFQLGGFASVLTEDESTGDEADEEGEEVGHGFGMISTLTSGPRSAGVWGVSKPYTAELSEIMLELQCSALTKI